MISDKDKLHLALIQIDNLANLLKDGPYFAFFTSHLLPIKYEIERQLTLLTSTSNSTKIKE